jgi:hypothetical protein
VYTGAYLDVADYGRIEPQLVRVAQDYKHAVIFQHNSIRVNTVSARHPENGSLRDIGTACRERLPSSVLIEVADRALQAARLLWAPDRCRVAPDSDVAATTDRHMNPG